MAKSRGELKYELDFPLHAAAGNGDVRKIQELLDSGIAIDKQDTKGVTALMVVFQTNDLSPQQVEDAITCLLDRGADPAIKTRSGTTAQSLAESSSHFEKFKQGITKLLSMTPEEYVEHRRRQGAIPEQDATRIETRHREREEQAAREAFINSFRAAQEVPERPTGMDINYHSPTSRQTALDIATEHDNVAVIESLLMQGARYDRPTNDLPREIVKDHDLLKKMIKSGFTWSGYQANREMRSEPRLTDTESQLTVKAYIACYLDVNRPDGTDRDQDIEKHISEVLKVGFRGDDFVQEHSDIVAKEMVRASKNGTEGFGDKILDVIDRIISAVSSKAAMQRELKEKAQHMVYSMKDKQPQVERGANLNTPHSPRATAINDDRGR